MLVHFLGSTPVLMSIGMDKKKITMKAIIYIFFSFVFIYRNLMSWQKMYFYIFQKLET